MVSKKPSKNVENIKAQFSITEPTARPPGFKDFISPPEIPYKIPFISKEKLRRWIFSIIVFRYYMRHWIMCTAKNQYFMGLYTLTFLGFLTSYRTFYKDQFLTYGLRAQLPGVAQQYHEQKWPTFHFVTCPQIVEDAKRLFGSLPTAENINNPFLHFVESPFLERLDLYPNVVVVQMSDYWSRLAANSLVGCCSSNQVSNNRYPSLALIPQKYTIQTLHPLEFAPLAERSQYDIWDLTRAPMDLGDEVPTRMTDIFYTETRAQSLPLPKISAGLYDALVEYQRLTSDVLRETRPYTSTFNPLRHNFVKWLFEISEETLVENFECGGIGFAGQKDSCLDFTRPKEVTDITFVNEKHPLFGNRSISDKLLRLKRRANKKVRVIKNPPFNQRASQKFESTTEKRRGRLNALYLNGLSAPNKLPIWNSSTRNWITNETAESPLLNANLRLGVNDSRYYHNRSCPSLPEFPVNPYPMLSKINRLQLRRGWLFERLFGMTPVRLATKRAFTEPEIDEKDSTTASHSETQLSLAQAIRRKLSLEQTFEQVSPAMRDFLIRLRTYRVAAKEYRKKKRQFEQKFRHYNRIEKNMNEIIAFWHNDIPEWIELAANLRENLIEDWSNAFVQGRDRGASRQGQSHFMSRSLLLTTPLNPTGFEPVKHTLTFQAWKEIIPLLTDRLIRAVEPTRADFQAVVHYLYGSMGNQKLGKNPRMRKGLFKQQDIYLKEKLEKNLKKVEKAGYHEFYTMLSEIDASQFFSDLKGPVKSLSDGPTRFKDRKSFFPTRPSLFKGLFRKEGSFGLRTAQNNQWDPVEKELIPKLAFFLLNRETTQGLSSAMTTHEDSDRSRIRWPGFFTGIESLRVRDLPKKFNEKVDFGQYFKSQDLSLPAGNEFHWCYSMAQLLDAMEECSKLRRQVMSVLTELKINPDDKRVIEAELGQPIEDTILELLKELSNSYLAVVSEAFREDNLKELAKTYPKGVEVAKAYSKITAYAVARREINLLVVDALSITDISERQRSLSRVIPRMTGFLFPDMAGGEQAKAVKMAWWRYKLNTVSLWDAFRTMTKIRPLEIQIPPGFRFYNAEIYGFPTHSKPRKKDLVPVSLFPHYALKRTDCELPRYEILQKIYGDLDVSFLIEKPRPGYPIASRGYAFDQAMMSQEQIMRSGEKADQEEKKRRRVLEWRVKTGSRQSIGGRKEMKKLKGNLQQKKTYTKANQLRRIRNQPNYFEHSRTLACKKGDLAVPETLLNWLSDFLLSPMNWMKDRKYMNFLGQAGLLRGDRATPFLKALQRRQMGASPPHQITSLFHKKADSTEPLKEKEIRLPSEFDGYYRESFVLSKRTVKVLQDQQKADRRDDKELISNYIAEAQKNHRNEDVNLPEKYLGQLNTVERLYFPRVTLSDWHTLFKKILEAAKDQPPIVIEIPMISTVAASRPLAFNGKINPEGSLVDPKVRARALAQILMLTNNPSIGSADDLDYRRLPFFGAISQPHAPGIQRQMHRPVIWHYRVPVNELVPEVLGTPTILERTYKREPTLQTETWTAFNDYVKKETGQKPAQALITSLPSWMVKSLRRIPGGEAALTKRFIFQTNREPVNIYWWFVAGKILFFAFCFELIKTTTYVVGKGALYKAALRLPLRSQRHIFRDFFLLIGVIKDERIRVVYDTPRRFKDIVAIRQKLLVQAGDIVWHLRNKGRPGGVPIPKGLLLAGPPGTGKTFLVQAIAGESKIPIIAQSTNTYMDNTKFLSPVYGLASAFTRARKIAPCILFIDEIDGMGRARSQVVKAATGQQYIVHTTPGTRGTVALIHAKYEMGAGTTYLKRASEIYTAEETGRMAHNRFMEDFQEDRLWEYERAFDFEPDPSAMLSYFYHEERVLEIIEEQDLLRFSLLIEFLVQMDGLRKLEGVLVIGATNRYNILDRAIIRPGRLEKTIFVQLPGFTQRMEILEFYAKTFGFDKEVSDNWDYLAHRTRGYTVADISVAINHAAIHAIVENYTMHNLDVVDFGINEIDLHKRLRGNLLPHPRVKRVPPLDPLYFPRQAYYQAGRALLQNILPTHPVLPYVNMEYIPFLPSESLQRLYNQQLDRFDFEMRIVGLLAGKAAEYLLLYGSSLENITARTERQIWESDCGLDEVGFASDMALHVVDFWFFTGNPRGAILKEMHTSEEGDIPRNFQRMPGRIPWLVESWMHERRKDYVALFSKFDTPDQNNIRAQLQSLTKWVGETKVVMTTAVAEFSEWWDFYLKSPHERPTTYGWRIREKYVQQPPRERTPSITAKNEQGHTGWTVKGKGLVWAGKNQEGSNQWREEETIWLIGVHSFTEKNYLERPPLISYNDWQRADRDYIWKALMTKSFDLAFELLDRHRPLLDRMATTLYRNGRLRQFEIDAMIEAYTENLLQLGQVEPFQHNDYKRLAPLLPKEHNLPVYGPRPQGQLPTLKLAHIVESPFGKFPYASKTNTKSVFRERTSDELEPVLNHLTREDCERFQKLLDEQAVKRKNQRTPGQNACIMWDIYRNAEMKLFQELILDKQNRQAVREYHLNYSLSAQPLRNQPTERKYHLYNYDENGQLRSFGSHPLNQESFPLK